MKMGKGNKGSANLLLIVGIIIVMFFTLVLFATVRVSKVTDQDKNSKENKPSATIIEPRDYGNGVYDFDATNDNFGPSLSSFIQKNQNLEIVAMTTYKTRGINRYGFFVVTRPKK